jgi:tetratricopeptide (TPR) repeat protein
MSEDELKDTQPNQASGDLESTQANPVNKELEATQAQPVKDELGPTQPNPVKDGSSSPIRKKFPGWLAVLVVVALIAIGILGGYASGMGQRYSAQNTLVSGQLQEQYQLGLQAVDAGQYEVAKQHFEYILQHKPDFPGVQSAYADLLLHMMITPTLTPTLTPTITPTPDTRSVDEIYNNVIATLSETDKNLCERDWNGIITMLDSLRKADITFHPAEVDGMYYMALRSRGVCKIYPQSFEPNASCQDLNINLEGGIYDLTMAERFGPLDDAAEALRTWARLYIAGASFWDQDWVQVKSYFAQVMANMPYLSDSACTSAIERWRLASVGYAKQLMAKGDYCGAEDQFQEAFTIDTPKNQEIYPIATQAQNLCNGGPAAQPPEGQPTESQPVATPTIVAPPTEAPTATPPPAETAAP